MNLNNPEARAAAERAYWEAVKDCLVEFHEFNVHDAENAVYGYQKEVVSQMSSPLLIFHEEPFYLANEIADKELPLAPYREKYRKIVQG